MLAANHKVLSIASDTTSESHFPDAFSSLSFENGTHSSISTTQLFALSLLLWLFLYLFKVGYLRTCSNPLLCSLLLLTEISLGNFLKSHLGCHVLNINSPLPPQFVYTLLVRS